MNYTLSQKMILTTWCYTVTLIPLHEANIHVLSIEYFGRRWDMSSRFKANNLGLIVIMLARKAKRAIRYTSVI